MYFKALDTIEGREIVPGYTAKFIHTDHLTLAYWTVTEGAVLPEHSHLHEQTAHVLAGEFELTVAGQVQRVTTGQVVVIPGGVKHSGKAITACQLLDVFYPIREDYR